MGKSGRKSSLKAALQSQQSRFKVKNKIAQAAQAAEQKGKKNSQNKGKGKASQPTVPFRPTDHILLIGEGNFSFARALIQNPPAGLESLPAVNVTATAFDTEAECYAKYPDAEAMVQNLRKDGVEVVFEVDATELDKSSALKGRRWNRIVWNFPHAGKGITDQDRNILANQLLIVGFLRSAAPFLCPGPMPTALASYKRKRGSSDDEDDLDDGEVPDNSDIDNNSLNTDELDGTRGTLLITLRNVSPYILWDVPGLAKNPPTSAHTKPNPQYTLVRSFAFHRSAWSGYEHRMTKGERARGEGRTGRGGEDRTWEFCLRSPFAAL